MCLYTCRVIHRGTDTQIEIYTDKRNPLLLQRSMSPASAYKNGLGTHTQCSCYFMSRVSIMPQTTEGESCYSCESVQSPDPRQIRSDQTLQTGKPNPYVPTETEEDQRRKAREEEEAQSVNHNLITPICHDLHTDTNNRDLLLHTMHEHKAASCT